MKTCQYGWKADTNCTAWGWPSPFHGCKLDDTHTGACECRCGNRRRMRNNHRKAA